MKINAVGENKAMEFRKDHAVQFIRHNMAQQTRTYPAGSRTDSSNYPPVPLWLCGCSIGQNLVFLLKMNTYFTVKRSLYIYIYIYMYIYIYIYLYIYIYIYERFVVISRNLSIHSI